jgi:hypothetical protein
MSPTRRRSPLPKRSLNSRASRCLIESCLKWQKRGEGGRCSFDWSQNSDFKTTVCVYSMRAKRQEPFISMPITWKELARAVDRGDEKSLFFTPDAALKRIKRFGDLFESVLTLEQMLTVSVHASTGCRAAETLLVASQLPLPQSSKSIRRECRKMRVVIRTSLGHDRK